MSGHVFHDKGQKLHYRKVQRTFSKAVTHAGITGFRFHDLRHCFASYLTQAGVDLYPISKLTGHRDLRMTKRYAHLNVDSLRGAIAELDVNLPLGAQKGAQPESKEAYGKA